MHGDRVDFDGTITQPRLGYSPAPPGRTKQPVDPGRRWACVEAELVTRLRKEVTDMGGNG